MLSSVDVDGKIEMKWCASWRIHIIIVTIKEKKKEETEKRHGNRSKFV